MERPESPNGLGPQNSDTANMVICYPPPNPPPPPKKKQQHANTNAEEQTQTRGLPHILICIIVQGLSSRPWILLQNPGPFGQARDPGGTLWGEPVIDLQMHSLWELSTTAWHQAGNEKWNDPNKPALAVSFKRIPKFIPTFPD